MNPPTQTNRNNKPCVEGVVFIPVEIRALTINEVIKTGLTIAREVLGSVDRYCLYEGGNEVVIEYWRGKELSVKLIYANDPARALKTGYTPLRTMPEFLYSL
jgi:hypothetical protein